MKYNLIISNKANILIKQHISFVGNVSKDAAKKLNKEFKDAIKNIASAPTSYQLFDGKFVPYSKYRKYVISKRYIVIYQIKEETIYIEYVIDTRTDYSFLIK